LYSHEEVAMKTKIVRIGNSQGIRIPKPMLEEAELGEEVELRLAPEGLVIERVSGKRAGWSAAAAQLALESAAEEDPFVASEFDEAAWEW
jgi:antitoxin MazE